MTAGSPGTGRIGLTAQGRAAGRGLIAIAAAALACALVAGGSVERAEAVTDCVITPPANIVTSTAPNQAGVTVNYPPPTTSGTCSTIVCSPPSGTFFQLGTTLVTCTSSTSPPAKGSFTIRVNDTQAPSVTVPQNITVGNDPGLPWARVSYSVTVTDNVVGFGFTCTHPSGFVFPIGTTTVSCRAHDSSGLTTIRSFDITVNDTEPPVFDAAPDVAGFLATGATTANVDYDRPRAHDNSTSAPVVVCTPASGSVFPFGATDVTCTAADPAGNVATETFRVVVSYDQYLCGGAIARLEEAKKDLKREKKFGTRAEIRKARKRVKQAQAQAEAECGPGATA